MVIFTKLTATDNSRPTDTSDQTSRNGREARSRRDPQGQRKFHSRCPELVKRRWRSGATVTRSRGEVGECFCTLFCTLLTLFAHPSSFSHRQSHDSLWHRLSVTSLWRLLTYTCADQTSKSVVTVGGSVFSQLRKLSEHFTVVKSLLNRRGAESVKSCLKSR